MPLFKNVAILGTGFMGTSIASVVHQKRRSNRLYGVEPNEAYRKTAMESGCYTDVCDSLSELADLMNRSPALENGELPSVILVCSPVETVVDLVWHCIGAFPEAVISDIGSTKWKIVEELEIRLAQTPHRFVGGHPIAGGESSGPVTPPDSIFTGKTFVATPTENTDPFALNTVEEFWKSLDCRTTRLSPERHDRLLAVTSHLPHVNASVLSAMLESQESDFCGTGWRDSTRIAKSNPLLWKEILVHNRESVLDALERFESILAIIRRAIDQNDWDTVIEVLEKGKINRDALGN